MLIPFDGDALDVYTSRRGVAVPERILRVSDRAGLLGDDARVAMTSLVQMHVPHTRVMSIPFEILDESVRSQRRSRSPRAVVPCPQRSICLEYAHPVTRREVVSDRFPEERVSDFPADVITALYFARQRDRLVIKLDTFSAQADHLLAAHPRHEVKEQQRVATFPYDVARFCLPVYHLDDCLQLRVRPRLDALGLVRLRRFRQSEARRVARDEGCVAKNISGREKASSSFPYAAIPKRLKTIFA